MKIYGWLFFLWAVAGLAQQPTSTPEFGLHNTTVVVKLLSPLSTKTAREGDVFTTTVLEPKQLAGAMVMGRITRMKKPAKGTGKGKAEVQFQFESITMNDRSESIKAELTDVKNSEGKEKVDEEGHVIGVSSHKKRIASVLLGAAAGAGIGAAAGGGKGAAAGAAIGGAAGLFIGLKMTTAASDIEFKPGSMFTLIISDAGNK